MSPRTWAKDNRVCRERKAARCARVVTGAFAVAYVLSESRRCGYRDMRTAVGRVAEWSIAAVLKTADVQASVGSNPTPSAKQR